MRKDAGIAKVFACLLIYLFAHSLAHADCCGCCNYYQQLYQEAVAVEKNHMSKASDNWSKILASDSEVIEAQKEVTALKTDIQNYNDSLRAVPSFAQDTLSFVSQKSEPIKTSIASYQGPNTVLPDVRRPFDANIEVPALAGDLAIKTTADARDQEKKAQKWVDSMIAMSYGPDNTKPTQAMQARIKVLRSTAIDNEKKIRRADVVALETKLQADRLWKQAGTAESGEKETNQLVGLLAELTRLNLFLRQETAILKAATIRTDAMSKMEAR